MNGDHAEKLFRARLQYDMEPPRDGYASRRMSAPPVCATTSNFSTGAFGATVESLATDTVLAAPAIVRTVWLPMDFAVTFSPEGLCAKAVTAKTAAKLIEYAVRIPNSGVHPVFPGFLTSLILSHIAFM